MATTMDESMFSNVLQNCRTLINDPEIFRQQNPENHENFKKISKNFYDHIAPSVISTGKSKSLKSLLINGFDDEQVWQQLEIQNKNTVQHLDSWISQITNDDALIDVDNEESAENNIDNSHVAEDNASSSDEEMEQDADEFSEDDSAEETPKNKNTPVHESDEEDSDFDEIKEEAKRKKKERSGKYKSKVDDQFFKLSKLEEFLRLEDLKEEKARDDELDESDDDEEEEEDIDLFQNISDQDLEDSEDESKEKSSKDYMFDDFFDGPESGDENVKHPDEASDFENEELNGDYANIPSDEDDSEDDEEESTSNIKSKTPFQIEQENIKKQISEYEESMVTPKPWQLTGEVDVNKRPIDGLLDLPTDFELNAKPTIIQDKEFCEKLENMIRSTIKNKAYSDGIRQEKPVEEKISMKKEIVIDQTKSKKGLAEEYEELYLKKLNKQEGEEQEDPKHLEIKKFQDSLFPELYALFSHIPKPAVPEIKIVSNLPAITVEEVAPTSHSDVTLLAPEEIKKRTGLTKGQTERTETDRNHERRKKKLYQKMKQKKENKKAEGKPLSSKATKREKLQVLKKLRQHKNTKIADMGAAKIKSSKDFFERLQETVSSKVSKNGVKQSKKKKKA